MKKVIYLLILILIIPMSLSAKLTLHVPKLNPTPTIDGKIETGEWDGAAVVETFYQTSPGDNTEPSEKTIGYLAYDDEFLYCGVHCFYDDPEKIRLFHCIRDKIYYTDRIFLYIDTFFSNAKAYYFGTNAFGEQADGIVLDDIDTSIDIHYDSFGAVTEDGYTVEMKIPLKNIKYKSGKNVQWGFFLKRHIEERKEEISATPIDRNGQNFYDNYGILIFEELPTNQNLKLIPSFLMSYTNDEDKIAGTHQVKRTCEPELNVFYEPNSNLTTTMTLNPDFSTIEADAIDIDVNTRFPTFYPEKRPFFIESTNPFRTPITIYHTRKIVDPIFGTKFSGAFGNNYLFGLGAIDENTDGARFIDGYKGSANAYFGFLTYDNKARSGNAFIRSALAVRRFKEYYNLVGDVDGSVHLLKNLSGYLQLVGSADQTLDKTWHKGFGYFGELTHDSENFFVNLELKAISKNFKADMGFIPENDIQFLESHGEWHKQASKDDQFVRLFEIGYDANVKYDIDFTKLKEHYLKPYTGVILNNKMEFWTGVEFQMVHYAEKNNYLYTPWFSFETYPCDFFVADIDIVGGKYMWFDVNDPRVEQFRKYKLFLNLRPTNKVDIDIRSEYQEMHSIYHAQVHQVTLKYQFNKQFWIRGILQYSYSDVSVDDRSCSALNIYPLFVYNPYANIAVYAGVTSLEQKDKEHD
ncbi:MAG: carbohydrate binding family 9 domain-containing protein, partial [Candidatus Cloacimonetes bacterium]|nr:carbohydrate binding family 9 domain-containing protein [Candidatus Cloacimonadota bacterium]